MSLPFSCHPGNAPTLLSLQWVIQRQTELRIYKKKVHTLTLSLAFYVSTRSLPTGWTVMCNSQQRWKRSEMSHPWNYFYRQRWKKNSFYSSGCSLISHMICCFSPAPCLLACLWHQKQRTRIKIERKSCSSAARKGVNQLVLVTSPTFKKTHICVFISTRLRFSDSVLCAVFNTKTFAVRQNNLLD